MLPYIASNLNRKMVNASDFPFLLSIHIAFFISLPLSAFVVLSAISFLVLSFYFFRLSASYLSALSAKKDFRIFGLHVIGEYGRVSVFLQIRAQGFVFTVPNREIRLLDKARGGARACGYG